MGIQFPESNVSQIQSDLSAIFDTMRQIGDQGRASFDAIQRSMEEINKLDFADSLKETTNEAKDAVKTFDKMNESMKWLDDVEKASKPMKAFGDAIRQGFAVIKEKTVKAMGITFKTMGKVGAGAASGMMRFFEILDKLVPIMDLAAGLLDVLVGAASQALMPAFEEFAKLLSDPQMIEFLMELGTMIGSVLAVALEFLSEALNELIQSGALEAIIEGMQFVTTVMQDVAVAMPEIWDAIMKFFSEDIPAWAEGVAQGWNDFWTGIGDAITDAMNTVADFFTTIWTTITTAITDAWNAIVVFFTGVWDSITTTVTDAWNSIVAFFTGIGDTIWDALVGVWDGIVAAFEAIGAGLTWIWDNIFVPIWDALETAFNAIVAFFATIINTINDIVQEIDVFDAIEDFSVPIPAAQTGAIAVGEQIVKVGDNQSGVEMLLPLEEAGNFGFGGNNGELILFELRRQNDLLQEQNMLTRRQATWTRRR